MKTFSICDKIAATVCFAIAMLTFGLTIEPTASFWDCPEFITTAILQEIGHPPGAPFFMLTGKVFSLFASDPSQYGWWINMLSALFSALTILFLYLTISHLVRKVLVQNNENITFSQGLQIIGSSMVGALAYTFSDTFWFSAVEAEVYAYSSFLTAFEVWLMLKWESHADEPRSDRYIILIVYLMGLSVGVHLLNLLTIPALVLIYYFRKYENANFKGSIVALLVSFAIIAVILYGIVPGCITLASYVELLFVNGFGLPFNSGSLFYLLLALVAIVWSLYELYRDNRSSKRIAISSTLMIALSGAPFIGGNILIGIVLLAALIGYFVVAHNKINVRVISTTVVAITAILLGYSCYSVTVIRSAANPPMDEGSPDNVFTLKTYLNREQYGDRPLLYGQYYCAKPKLKSDGQYCRPVYKEIDGTWTENTKSKDGEKDVYVKTPSHQKLVYDDQFMTFLPRMHSTQGSHARAYERWIDIKGKTVKYDQCGRKLNVKVPTFFDNLNFMFTYQMNYMYWRYFMWNFSGRQNDIQGRGDIMNGNWITGFNFIDKIFIGDQTDLPDTYANNKGHNKYYMLPFILGILGLAYQIISGKKGNQSFWITLVLFFMMGLAIVLYLNQGPAEPRERDYAYAGSFYAFAIWIGFGVAGLARLLSDCKVSTTVASAIAVILALPVPALMASENWDDHDRSNRYIVRDFALNYFNSTAPQAIIYTNGDNDTFPLWYTMDTEQNPVAIDKRVCNLSYLQTDWYIDQMRAPQWESKGCPISWQRKDYIEGQRDIVLLRDNFNEPLDLKWALDTYLLSDNPSIKDDGEYFIPTKKFYVPVNVDGLIKQGAITEEQRGLIADTMFLDMSSKSYLTKSDIMILEMIANSNWERPIYFAVTVGGDMNLGLTKYFQLEGMCYRIVPFKNAPKDGRVDTDKMYDNIMNKFKYGNLADPKVYLDENILRMCSAQRQMTLRLVEALLLENKKEKALEVLNHCLEQIPDSAVPLGYTAADVVDFYLFLGEKDKAKEIALNASDIADDNLRWLGKLDSNKRAGAHSEIVENLYTLQHIAGVCDHRGDKETADEVYAKMDKHAALVKYVNKTSGR